VRRRRARRRGPHHRDAQAAEIVHVARLRVAAGDGGTASHEELGEGAHAGAGDADEVDRTRI
jgi:hypothetical protein